jgi:hypothetical protein
MTGAQPQHLVFLSHAGAQKRVFVARMFQMLTLIDEAIRPFMDEECLQPGGKGWETIEQAANSCAVGMSRPLASLLNARCSAVHASRRWSTQRAEYNAAATLRLNTSSFVSTTRHGAHAIIACLTVQLRPNTTAFHPKAWWRRSKIHRSCIAASAA